MFFFRFTKMSSTSVLCDMEPPSFVSFLSLRHQIWPHPRHHHLEILEGAMLITVSHPLPRPPTSRFCFSSEFSVIVNDIIIHQVVQARYQGLSSSSLSLTPHIQPKSWGSFLLNISQILPLHLQCHCLSQLSSSLIWYSSFLAGLLPVYLQYILYIEARVAF